MQSLAAVTHFVLVPILHMHESTTHISMTEVHRNLYTGSHQEGLHQDPGTEVTYIAPELSGSMRVGRQM